MENRTFISSELCVHGNNSTVVDSATEEVCIPWCSFSPGLGCRGKGAFIFRKTSFPFLVITCKKDAKYIKISEIAVVNYTSYLKSFKVLMNERSEPLGCGVQLLRCFRRLHDESPRFLFVWHRGTSSHDVFILATQPREKH